MANDLQEALLTAGGAAALVAKVIDPVLLEYQRRYAPLCRSIPSQRHGSTVYYFNKRTTIPAGGFVTDGGARPISTSNYAQENFIIKLLQTVGAVTGYAQEVTAATIGNLRAREIEGAARGLYWDVETALTWGAASPTAAGAYPQFDGLDTICASFTSASSGGPSQGVGGGGIDNYGGSATWALNNYSPWVDGKEQNAIDFLGSSLTLGGLDLLIDMVESNVAEPVNNSEWMFVMSPTANSRLAQLLINQQRFMGEVSVAPGLIVPTYRDIPVVKTSFLSPRTNKMGTVTATAASGGSLTSGTIYNYIVAPVIARFGEIQGSTASNATPSGGNLEVALTFSTPTGPEGLAPTHYKVYGATGSTPANTAYVLLGVVDAFYLDSSGNVWPTTKVTDTGAALVPNDGTHAIGTAPTAYYYGNAGLHPLTSAGEQSIYLMSRDPNFILRPYVREMTPVTLYPTTASPDSLPFAFVTDTTLAIRGTKYLGRLSNVAGALDKTAGNGIQPTNNSYTPTFVVD
jgi:hypothetical protein